ncbi:beta-galactosidase 7-like [Cucumis melo var. makuwa]|uniref:Beta-galactosidase 7-like n=1 Tax=Cucumis melo var. makuwa TaxID=1194695 RepID=A0A5A7T293_CUCMM|nr:beta-galactosidase 7-like [Cucumis melo var. makuwa]TYK30979.1 beta-galactosidase 7-like [Cucumis melo var. makuwa]
MIWYMASFKTLAGIDPVVLDMQGMGKGQAWGGHVISDIQFASYGNPEGKCGSFKQGSWDVTTVLFLWKSLHWHGKLFN